MMRYYARGAVLPVALMLLFVITLLGIAALQATSMEERMSANLEDKFMSTTAAESALVAGESWVLNLTAQPAMTQTCSTYPCVQGPNLVTSVASKDSSWWQSNSTQYASSLNSIASKPRYYVEYLQYVPDTAMLGSSTSKSTGVYYYQVTSMGTGATDNAVSVLQTTMARRF